MRRFSAAATAVALTAAWADAQPPPVSDLRLRNPRPENWLMYRRTYDGWSFSPLQQIDSRNVADLVPAWAFDEHWNNQHFQATPIVNEGRMFVASGEQVVSLDAATGRLLWRHVHAFPDDIPPSSLKNRGAALHGTLLYVGTMDARVVALEATTGRIAWERQVADYRTRHYFTMAPLVVNGKVLIGTSGGEHGVRGFVVALDATSGEELWRFHTIPAPGEPGNETWQGDDWRHGGGAVWLTGTYDPGLNVTYWGVGNGGPWTGDARPGDNLYTNSTIALNPDTGGLITHRQYLWNGSWDWDESVAPLLLDVKIARASFPVLLYPARHGFLWAFARRPASMPFLGAVPFVHNNVIVGIDPRSGRPSYDPSRTPRIGYRALFCPSTEGGRDWRPEAFSPRTRMLYIPASENLCTIMEGQPVEYVAGERFTGAVLENDETAFRRAGARYVGQLQAWDVETMQRAWVREFPHKVGSVLATAGDLVFVDHRGSLVALSATSGETLWAHELADQLGSPIATYAVDGIQYVVIQATGRIVAFALDCQC